MASLCSGPSWKQGALSCCEALDSSSWACLQCFRLPVLHGATRDVVGSHGAMSRSVTPGEVAPPSHDRDGHSRTGPTSLGYEMAAAVGFDLVLSRVRQQLQSRDFIGTDSLSATSDPPAVMRRSDGTFYQSSEAWWGDERRLLVFGYEREMERVGEKQFRPASTWSVNGILSRLGPVGDPERSVWRFDASGAGEAARKTSETDDPLDLLPPELVRPLRDGDADRGGSTERDGLVRPSSP